MRIISGKYRGRTIVPPRNLRARPTTDFAKENLFNVLVNLVDFEELDVLDLFSGTGSISYELASREALHITAIEMSEKHIAYIRKMCADLKIDNIRVMRQDVFRYLTSTQTSFDFIFADPPYQLENIADIPDLVFKHNHLNRDGLLIVEHGSKTSFENHPNFVDHRNYGNVHFSFFRTLEYKEAEGEE